jgi:tetratricopeptide (TPR) repeat protein
LPKALEAYQSAIEHDPNYALAHVGIADFYIWANIYGLIPTDESYKNAEAATRRALQIDSELGEAYASMGLILQNKFEYAKAERMFKKAIELTPNYSHAHEWYSAALISTGRFDAGLEEILTAERLDPMSLRTKVLVVWSYYQLRMFAKALEKAEEVINLDSNFPQGHLQLGYVLCELERPDEAIKEVELVHEFMPGSSMAEFFLAFAYKSAGREADAAKIADRMAARSRTEYVKPMFLGLANIAASDPDKAFDYFERAVEERDPWLAWFGTEPKLDAVRDDQRYTKLLARTNKTIDGGRVRILDPVEDDFTSTWRSEADTSPEPEIPTQSSRVSFVKRHSWKFATAGIVVVALIAAYAAGIVVVNYNGSPMVLRQIPAPTRSIAVLPFENATGDPANDYISDGMSESLISRLSNSGNVRAVPRSATFPYRGRELDPMTIGRELGVESVVTGTLQKQNDDFVLKLDMTGVADGKSQLSASIIEQPDRIFAFQEAMYARIADALGLQMGSAALQRSYTENNEAFQLYLKGEHSRQAGTPAGTAESLDLYNQAIALDPNYALAYQGLALAYRSSPAYGSMTPNEAFPKSKEAAEKALSLDPSLSTAYASLASIKATYDWDFPGAEQEYKRAIQLGPNNAEIHYSYGNFLVAMGRTDEALVELRNALQIDPSSLNVQTNIGWALYISGRMDEAASQIRQVIARDPTFARAHLNLGEILEEQGRHEEAIASIQRARELSKDPLAEMALGHALASAGRRADAEKVATDLEEKVRQKQVSPFLPAVVYAGLKDNDKAFYWLERAYQERSNWLALIKVGRRLKGLSGDPRFDDLIKRIGFPT